MRRTATPRKQPRKRAPTHIRDARGRKVTQLDPVELSLLRQHDVIDRPTLHAITTEVGTGMEDAHRRMLWVLYAGVPVIAVVLVAQLVDAWMGGNVSGFLSGRNIALGNVWFLVLVLWFRAKQARFGRVRRAMLAHLRCPHCGYDMHGLPPEPDGATLCPECGTAWRLDQPPQSSPPTTTPSPAPSASVQPPSTTRRNSTG
jgi:hypothetical protein